MKTTLALLFILLITGAGVSAEKNFLTPSMTGHWEGSALIIVDWCRQKDLPVRIEIRNDASVTGTVGDAVLTGIFKQNRGLLGRKLNIKTDYIVTGSLRGPVIAAEGITRSGVFIPLNFINNTFVGGVNTSGSKFGGKEQMILSARGLTLVRMVKAHTLPVKNGPDKKALEKN